MSPEASTHATKPIPYGLATRAVHNGQAADPVTGATIPPIHMTTTFTQAGVGGEPPYEYSRTGNPTRTALETCLASLEGGDHGLAFASGSAATAAVLSLLRPGDRVVAADDLYGGTYRLFSQVFAELGIEFVYVDGRDPDAFRQARDAELFWVETPTNPLLHLVDIEAVAAIAHDRGALLAVDSTFATPCFQQPLALGADIVVHSTTKYLGGHSDAVGGAVVTSNDGVFERLRFYQNAAGAVPGPFEAWLTLRGLKTLQVRMRQHEENARKIAAFLDGHSRVEAVSYPGLPDYPQAELMARQMAGSGGMVTVRLVGGRAQADAFVRALQLFSFAESLGGVESLVCHPATMTHASYPEEERARRGITESLLRLSVGIEDAEDLIDDLSAALEAVTESMPESGAQ
jgi:cystathionine beta-lyase/cystathionine gamma-synthase